MTDKESEAKLELNRYIYGKNLDKDDIVEYLSIIFGLINKQSKEIEELKEKIKTFKIEDENIYLQFGEITEKKRWKDKIKAKIEEVKDGTFDGEIVLRSLLEKE